MIDPHALRTLIEQWKVLARKTLPPFTATRNLVEVGMAERANGLMYCANELEALLSALPETPQGWESSRVSGVKPGQIWRDRDKRMSSGNRRVRVVRVEGFRDTQKAGASITDGVFYHVIGSRDQQIGTVRRSRLERFQKAFDLVDSAPPPPSEERA